MPEFQYDKKSKIEAASIPFSKQLSEFSRLTIDFDLGTTRSFIYVTLIISYPSFCLDLQHLLPPETKTTISSETEEEFIRDFKLVIDKLTLILPKFEGIVMSAMKTIELQ